MSRSICSCSTSTRYRESLVQTAMLARRPAPRIVYARHLLEDLQPHGRENFWRMTRTLVRDGGRCYVEFQTTDNDPTTTGRTVQSETARSRRRRRRGRGSGRHCGPPRGRACGDRVRPTNNPMYADWFWSGDVRQEDPRRRGQPGAAGTRGGGCLHRQAPQRPARQLRRGQGGQADEAGQRPRGRGTGESPAQHAARGAHRRRPRVVASRRPA